MAKKPAPVSKKPATPIAKAAPASTPVRNTPVPKPVTKAAPKKEISHADIARRAFEIHCSGTGGSETDNWYRAERELRGL